MKTFYEMLMILEAEANNLFAQADERDAEWIRRSSKNAIAHMHSSHPDDPDDPSGGGGNQGGGKPLMLRLFYKEGEGFTGPGSHVRQAYVCKDHFLNDINEFVAFNRPGGCPSCSAELAPVTLSELEEMYHQVQQSRHYESPKLMARSLGDSHRRPDLSGGRYR